MAHYETYVLELSSGILAHFLLLAMRVPSVHWVLSTICAIAIAGPVILLANPAPNEVGLQNAFVSQCGAAAHILIDFGILWGFPSLEQVPYLYCFGLQVAH